MVKVEYSHRVMYYPRDMFRVMLIVRSGLVSTCMFILICDMVMVIPEAWF